MKDNFITEAFIFTLANTWNKKYQSYFLVNSFICFPSENCGIQRTILFFLIMQKKKKNFLPNGTWFLCSFAMHMYVKLFVYNVD